jgi:polyferredoxin
VISTAPHYGVRLVRRLTGDHLVWLIAFLLIGIGALLLWEAVFPFQYAPLLPAFTTVHLLAGILIGIGIGLVSSVLGVAGGELLFRH